MSFQISDKQKKEIKEWQDKIKEIFGEYGLYDYIFTPYGMGTGLVVRSHLTKTELDVTHEEDW
jgi:hypothetical protein